MYILWYTPGSSISTFFCSEKFLLGFTPIPTFNAHSNLKTHIWILTDGYLRWFPREIRSYFLLPKHKVQKCPKSGAITLVWKKKPLKKQKSLSEHLFAFFRGCSHMMMYMHSHRSERILCQILPKTDPTLVKDVGRTCHRKCWHGRCAQLSVISSSPYE